MAEYIERERWKIVPDFGGKYRVSNFGRIMNEKGILLSPFLTHGGYLMIALYHEGKRTNLRLHRLVAKAFVPVPDIDCKMEVNHKNGVKTDNRANNLEWCTRSENMKHAYKKGLQTKGKSLVRKIQCVEDGFVCETIGEASRKYNINPKTIQSSCTRLSTRGKRNFRYYDGERRCEE
jgi:hypothetical protein